MASEANTTEVREQHRFRQEDLEGYLCLSLPGFPVEPREALTIRQYSLGQSNPTFYLKKGLKTYVLRKKPHGPLLPQAHKIDREYRIQKALFAAGFPVPEPLLYCSDVSVIGTEFYVMQHVQGRIFRDITLPEVSPAERSALYIAIIETLAKLHSFNVSSLGLQDYGRGAGYCKRQVSVWMRQYQAAAHIQIPAMTELSEWLMSNLPDDDDNEVTLARVMAVLDWELSTLGHPLADLAYTLAFCFWPRALKPIKILNLQDVNSIGGIPSPEELITIYSRFRDTSTSPHNLNFFLALSYFKLASISQGIYARYLLGNSSAENSLEFSSVVKPLAEVGLQEIVEYYARKKNSPDIWRKPNVMEKLKEKAKAEGLWNLFLPAVSGLGQLDYALIAEETGKCFFAPEVFNCHAPDTGNMEVLHLYGTEEQKKQWLDPLLEGKINSCFCMTEPDAASSDATNIKCNIQRDGDSYIINGKKWWSSGAGNPNCKFAIVMGKDKNTFASKYKQHSMIIVPMDTPGVKLIRPLSVFGYFDYFNGGHFEIHFNDVREVVAHWIAECRIAIEQARFAYVRTLRVADGPDEVHLSAIAKLELLDQARELNAHL
ncbi:hypothetical protein Chor_008736 [Crotalus horridus]